PPQDGAPAAVIGGAAVQVQTVGLAEAAAAGTDRWGQLTAAATGAATAAWQTCLAGLSVQAAARLHGLQQHPRVQVHRLWYGDCWLRDTAPLWGHDVTGGVAARCFAFNGWGQKFAIAGDAGLAGRIAAAAQLPWTASTMVLEGGGIDVDGEGRMLVSACLVDACHNPAMDKAAFEAALWTLGDALVVLWLEGALAGDHTDGHVDTLARFIAPGVAVCMQAPAGHVNAAVLQGVQATLRAGGAGGGRPLRVCTLPAPDPIEDRAGRMLPASYCNFYFGHSAVFVPQYGVPQDSAALACLAALLPTHPVVGVPALAILRGGGALHCITQQQPKACPAARVAAVRADRQDANADSVEA
ncbi:MAG: agmatine deiminase family protein, partial [Polyangiales bacterium]